MSTILLVFMLVNGQPDTKELVDPYKPELTPVMQCHQWALIVQSIVQMGSKEHYETAEDAYRRFNVVFGNRLTIAAKAFAEDALRFVKQQELMGVAGDVPYLTAMLNCNGYRML